MAKKKKYNDLTLEEARELFRYENGKLYWNTKIKNSKYSIGDQVGSKNRLIPIVELRNRKYSLHRIVYLLHHGFCPVRIDFKDKTLTAEGGYDISIENLYEPPKKAVTRKSKNKYKEDLSYFEANTYFEYRNGRLYWKEINKRGHAIIGQLAGGREKDSPFLKVMLHYKSYMQHRIVYLLHHRYLPEVVTFKDKTLTHEGLYDISIENLKASTHSHEKGIASFQSSNKTSKYRGVSFDIEAKKYRVHLSANRVKRFGGYFENELEAARKYDEMARQFVGEDAILNFPEEWANKHTPNSLVAPSALYDSDDNSGEIRQLIPQPTPHIASYL